MVWAVNIKSTNDTAHEIYRLWSQVEKLEHNPSMSLLEYPPHFTFAIYDKIDLQKLRVATKQVFQSGKTVSILFDSIKYFDAENFVLWASPKFNSELVGFHNSLHAKIDPVLCHHYYRPKTWQPHCTLAMKIKPENREKALAMTKAPFEPFKVVFDSADCLEFPPVKVIDQYKLGNR